MTDSKPTATIYRAREQQKPWGREVIFAEVDGKYVGKLIHVVAGQSLSCQYHVEKEETISVVSGQAIVEYGPALDELNTVRMVAGDTIHLPVGVIHRIEAATDLLFAECSTAFPGWQQDVVRLGDKYGRQGTQAP